MDETDFLEIYLGEKEFPKEAGMFEIEQYMEWLNNEYKTRS